MLIACGVMLTLSTVNALVPPHSFVAVLFGSVALEGIRVFTFHSVTRFAPPVPPKLPVPTKSRSVVPSKKSSRGEHVPTGLAAPLMCRLSDIAGTAFINPLGALKESAYKLGLLKLLACVPHPYRVPAPAFGPVVKYALSKSPS